MVSEYPLDFVLSHRKYLTFIIGGGIGLALSLIVTYAFTTILQLWHMFSYVFGLAAAIIFTFAFHRQVTFNNKSKARDRLIKFVAVTLVLAGLNWLLVLFFTEGLLVFYVYAIFGVTFGISIINYYSNKHWVLSSDYSKTFKINHSYSVS